MLVLKSNAYIMSGWGWSME